MSFASEAGFAALDEGCTAFVEVGTVKVSEGQILLLLGQSFAGRVAQSDVTDALVALVAEWRKFRHFACESVGVLMKLVRAQKRGYQADAVGFLRVD